METIAIIFWIGAFVVFYTYVGYGMLLWMLVKVKESVCRPVQPALPEELPEVTLFIAAYNEELIVKDKMANCRELNYPAEKLKIMWVTDGSNDRTNDLLSEYPDVSVRFSPERRGKTAAFNRGMPFVTTPYVVYTDANTMLNPDAIREIIRQFMNPLVGCVAGEKRVMQQSQQSAESTEGIYWKYESKLKELDFRLYSAVGAAGELFAIRTNLFANLPEDTLLDDFTLSMRIAMQGSRIAYCSAAYAVEGASADMKEEGKRKVRIAAGGLQSIYRLGGLFNIFRYGVLSWQYISHRVLRWSITPVLLFALLPLNVVLALNGQHKAFYMVVLALQGVFYLCGLGGYLLAKRKLKNKLLFVPYYFLFMNVNVLLGIRYLVRKRGSGAWEKAKRAA